MQEPGTLNASSWHYGDPNVGGCLSDEKVPFMVKIQGSFKFVECFKGCCCGWNTRKFLFPRMQLRAMPNGSTT
eukprot:m.177210 g.177210  ORF g.177210 m.177210 type:complete len:73 (+) comp15453_c0_seq7:5287-5505(+)